ncbi:MAG: phage tail assembly protein [Proteobacteria bacterium]|nr:phage tail assembly protein [Pseudomonadota bacterium]MBU1640072.1 phage tail assembly protein [Pseudomonadota bacterium]
MNQIKLKHPVEIDGATVDSLDMRRPKVKDQLAADKGAGGNAAKEVRLFANLCEVVPATIEELDLSDYQQLQETYTSFLS